MAKYVANVSVIEETNLPALFYYKHLLEGRLGNPVYYFDEIDKAGIDERYKNVSEPVLSHLYTNELAEINNIVKDVTKTVWHGFKYSVVHENVKDEGLAKKQAQAITKMIKNHEAPYNDIFKKYSVTIIQG